MGKDKILLRKLDMIFASFADPETKELSFGDFIAAMIEFKGEVTEDLIRKAFITIAGDQEA